MSSYLIVNYEEHGEDQTIGRIETETDGCAVLILEGREAQAFRNKNAALTAVREHYGWPAAYLQ